jgi:hypothetical protein
MEARVDAVFASLMKDPGFLELTRGADGRIPIPQAKTMNQTRGSSKSTKPEIARVVSRP